MAETQFRRVQPTIGSEPKRSHDCNFPPPFSISEDDDLSLFLPLIFCFCLLLLPLSLFSFLFLTLSLVPEGFSAKFQAVKSLKPLLIPQKSLFSAINLFLFDKRTDGRESPDEYSGATAGS